MVANATKKEKKKKKCDNLKSSVIFLVRFLITFLLNLLLMYLFKVGSSQELSSMDSGVVTDWV